MKKYVYILAALLAATTLRAQKPECPVDTVNGEEVYRYEVEKSIGLYRIGKNFDVPQSEIVRMNPQLKERGLHFGETLYIPTGRKIEAQAPVKHDTVVIVDTVTIVRHDTIMIAATNQVAVADTLAATDTTAVDSVAAQTIMPADTIAADSVAAVAPVVPFLTQPADGQRTVELALMLPFESKQTKRGANAERIMEFYQGALLALHEAQNDSIFYRLRVYDTERSDRRVAELCDTSCIELENTQGIIGLAYPVQIERMSEWCQAHNVPLLLPFSDDVNLAGNPQLMQFNSTDAQEAEAFCRWISQRDTILHCVTVEAKEAEVAGCVRELHKKMKTDKIASVSTTIRDVLNDSIEYALDAAKTNLIILHSDKYNRVRTMIPHIEQYARRGYDIILLSQYSWQREDIRLPQIYTSVFTGLADLTAYDALWNKYFATEHVSDTPRYDLLGYDLMNAMLRWLQGEQEYTGMQSDIHWFRANEEDGWQNTGVQVVER